MAKGDYYYPFFYQRFYSSTQGWTEEQEGAYMRLLTYQFDKGSIPNDIKKIKKISPKAAKNWSLFESKFIQNPDGNLINPVMDGIRKNIQDKKRKNLENGKLGGRPKTERLVKTKPNGFDLDNQTVSKTETQTKPIPITNNQILNTEREKLSSKFFDAEKTVLDNPIQFERLCMKYGKSAAMGKSILRKYHLHLVEKELYPKSRPAIFAGFEKWLMNERSPDSDPKETTKPKDRWEDDLKRHSMNR